MRADTYSKSKYASVISQSGGWDWFQALLRELDGVARKHDVDIATVASRWVLDQPQVIASPTPNPMSTKNKKATVISEKQDVHSSRGRLGTSHNLTSAFYTRSV